MNTNIGVKVDGLREMSPRQLFDHAMTKSKAYGPGIDYSGPGALYRDGRGGGCAAGFCIPDVLYHSWMEGHRISGLHLGNFYNRQQIAAIQVAQFCHDQAAANGSVTGHSFFESLDHYASRVTWSRDGNVMDHPWKNRERGFYNGLHDMGQKPWLSKMYVLDQQALNVKVMELPAVGFYEVVEATLDKIFAEVETHVASKCLPSYCIAGPDDTEEDTTDPDDISGLMAKREVSQKGMPRNAVLSELALIGRGLLAHAAMQALLEGAAEASRLERSVVAEA